MVAPAARPIKEGGNAYDLAQAQVSKGHTKRMVVGGWWSVYDFKLGGKTRTRTRTNTSPYDTEANAAGRSGNARALRKQSKCGVYHEGEGHWPKFSQNL